MPRLHAPQPAMHILDRLRLKRSFPKKANLLCGVIILKLRRGAPALEWFCDVTGRTARVTSIGNRLLLVENHCGVEAFGTDRIVLRTHCGSICVEGTDMLLRELRRDALIVEGDIRRVQLPCGRDERHEP